MGADSASADIIGAVKSAAPRTATPGNPRLRVVGNGPISLVLRGLLHRQGFTAPELDCDDNFTTPPPWLAARAIALSQGSVQVLQRIARVPEGATIRKVDVTLAGAPGHVLLQSDELRLPALGRVVRYDLLLQALRDGLSRGLHGQHASGDGSATVPPARFGAGPAQEHADAWLTIIADGDPGEHGLVRDFGQSAVVGTVQSQRPATGTAFERFTRHGPLALLPQPGERLWSFVWCAPHELAQQRAGLPAEAFAAALQQAFGPTLGTFECVDKPAAVALQRRVRSASEPGQIAIGNASQALHPVAGQGMNLGLRDAFVLAQMLGDARAHWRSHPERPPDAARLAQAFERERALDRRATIAATDTLAAAFASRIERPAHAASLSLLDVIAPVRRSFARAFVFGLRH